MHQTKKGNQWHFGMKAHIGADAQSGLVHTVTGTAANVADIAQTRELLHGKEKQVHADARYLGVEKREEVIAKDRLRNAAFTLRHNAVYIFLLQGRLRRFPPTKTVEKLQETRTPSKHTSSPAGPR